MGDVYPATPAPDLGYSSGQAFQTYGSAYPSGRIVTGQARWAGLYRLTLRYSCLQDSDLSTILQFHARMRGKKGRFTFVSPRSRAWYRLYVGVGDGVTTTYDLPASVSSALTVYVAGVTTTTFTQTFGVGTDGRDRITFTGAIPASGAVIEVDLTGFRRAYGHFTEDELTFADQESHLSLTVSLEESPA